MNLYGFRRLTTGTDRNGYYHELFLRGRPDLLKKMTRVRVKGIGCKLAPSPATEPNFYTMKHCQLSQMSNLLLNEESGSSSQTMNKGSRLSRNASGFLEAYMAGKLGQSKDLLPMTAAPNSLFLQVSGRRAASKPSKSSAIPAFCSSTTDLPSFHPTEIADDDLTPLQSSGSMSHLLDMQDDIISLLNSCKDLSGGNNNHNDSIVPPRTSSGGNILSDMANFWEI